MAVFVIIVVHWIAGICVMVGGLTSMLCGYIGMQIATYANNRTAHAARISLSYAFKVAYGAGSVMGFCLVSLSLLNLLILIIIFYYGYVTAPMNTTQFVSQIQDLFEYIAGYGLGGSTVALFGRVGGGIYTKAAGVGADLVGKVE